jgi:hypothetical protein
MAIFPLCFHVHHINVRIPTRKMPTFEKYVDFDPIKEIPSLDGKVIFITGGKLRTPLYICQSGDVIKSLTLDVRNHRSRPPIGPWPG